MHKGQDQVNFVEVYNHKFSRKNKTGKMEFSEFQS